MTTELGMGGGSHIKIVIDKAKIRHKANLANALKCRYLKKSIIGAKNWFILSLFKSEHKWGPQMHIV